jgi:hypothetical protein
MTQAAENIGLKREEAQLAASSLRIFDGDGYLDQEARDIGHKAIGRIDTHEVLCTERWNQQRIAVAVMQKTLDTMAKNTLGRVPAGLIAGLTGMVGWLAARAFPIH